MKLHNILMTGLIISSLSTAVMAQNEPFEASIALGYVGTTGNTDTTTFNTEVLVTLRTDNWAHDGKLQALGAQDTDATTAERFLLEEKSDFNLDEMNCIFGRGAYLDDRFSGYNYQASVAAGYGHYFIKNDNLSVDAFGGLGYRESDVVDGDSQGEGIVTLGENLSWQLSPNSALVQSFTSDIGEEFTVSRFEIGLTANIIDRIATKIAFQARNTSEVPVGNKKTDTQTSVSLVYSF